MVACPHKNGVGDNGVRLGQGRLRVVPEAASPHVELVHRGLERG